jgi:DNA-binding winged helix-turn-helix (wHTH) protein/Tol biopolymer transport system component
MASPHVVYEFGEFHLDRDERVLRRGSAPVALTPKATDILLALIDNRGHIVEKADLMQQVWPDISVEEGNLSQNVYTLRRVLTDARGKCPFIETVPRRGYRFVGAVRVVQEAADDRVPAEPMASEIAPTASLANEPAALLPTTNASTDANIMLSRRRPWRRRTAAWVLVVLGTGVMGAAASWLTSDRASEADAVPPVTPPLTRLTHVGNVVRATISRKGHSLVYAVSTGSRESLWAKDLDSGRVMQLIEPSVGTYHRGGGLSSGPDESVYYAWFRPDLASVGIFRIRQDGGLAEPMTNVRDLPAFDPQGTRFACITTFSMPFGESRLLVYDAAGRSPRVVALRARPMTFLQMRPAWSPDGRQLAAWTSSEREPGMRTLLVVGVDDGRERVVTRQLLHGVDGMVWLPDGASVVVAARKAASAPLRLWQIALSSGAMRPLTTDISDYLLAGLTSEGKQLAAVRVDVARNLWTAPLADVTRAQQVGSDAGELSELESLAWMFDGRLLYTSTESGNADIWVYDPAKDRRRQLTTNGRDDFNPASSADGTIVFASDRSDATGLWAMSDAGESSVRQLTAGGDSRPAISPDGAVVFQRGTIQSAPIELWRMPLNGGAPVRLAEGVSIRPAVSPDGRMVAFYWLTAERWTLAVVPMNGGQPLQVFPLSPTHCERTVRWSPDSKALAYVDCDGGVANIWLHQLDGSPPRRLTDFRSGHITTFDWTRDGSRLAWITRNQVSDVVLIDVPPPIPPS